MNVQSITSFESRLSLRQMLWMYLLRMFFRLASKAMLHIIFITQVDKSSFIPQSISSIQHSLINISLNDPSLSLQIRWSIIAKILVFIQTIQSLMASSCNNFLKLTLFLKLSLTSKFSMIILNTSKASSKQLTSSVLSMHIPNRLLTALTEISRAISNSLRVRHVKLVPFMATLSFLALLIYSQTPSKQCIIIFIKFQVSSSLVLRGILLILQKIAPTWKGDLRSLRILVSCFEAQSLAIIM